MAYQPNEQNVALKAAPIPIAVPAVFTPGLLAFTAPRLRGYTKHV